MTRKQYYLRLGKLIKLDLVKRVGKKYALTNFGYVIYEAQLTLVMVIISHNAINPAKYDTHDEGFEVMNQIIV
jgi:predicted transcriptional regulator